MILVDDGSPDNAGKICDEYAAKDDRISVIHKQNGGLAAARNTGIEACNGKYFMIFEGSDLLVSKETLQNIHDTLIKREVDIYFARLQDMLEKGWEVTGVQAEYCVNGYFEDGGQELFIKLYDNQDVLALSSPVNKVFRTAFVKDNDLWFYPGIYHDDDEWLPRTIALSKVSYFTNDIIYNALTWDGCLGGAVSDKVAVLVGTCDAYNDIWRYFFYFVDIHWKDCPYQFYLLTEEYSYDWTSPLGSELKVIHTKKGSPWSERILVALKEIKEDYIVFILDDSFILDPVRQNVIESCVSELEKDKMIGCFHFEEFIPNPYHIKSDFIEFRQMDKRENFLASAYVTLWRKTFLKKILQKKESPWQFELYATERCRHYKEKIYVLDEDSPSVIHYYIKGKGGYGVSGGKWAPNTVNLFKKYSLECDFSKRGFYDADKILEEEKKPRNPKLSFVDKILLPFTDMKLFKEKIDPRIQLLRARIDIKGRISDAVL